MNRDEMLDRGAQAMFEAARPRPREAASAGSLGRGRATHVPKEPFGVPGRDLHGPQSRREPRQCGESVDLWRAPVQRTPGANDGSIPRAPASARMYRRVGPPGHRGHGDGGCGPAMTTDRLDIYDTEGTPLQPGDIIEDVHDGELYQIMDKQDRLQIVRPGEEYTQDIRCRWITTSGPDIGGRT